MLSQRLEAELRSLRGELEEARKLCDQALTKATGNDRESGTYALVSTGLRHGRQHRPCGNDCWSCTKRFPTRNLPGATRRMGPASARHSQVFSSGKISSRPSKARKGSVGDCTARRRLLLGIKQSTTPRWPRWPTLQQEIERRQPDLEFGIRSQGTRRSTAGQRGTGH